MAVNVLLSDSAMNSPTPSLHSVIPQWTLQTAMNSPIESLHSVKPRWTLQLHLFTQWYRNELTNSISSLIVTEMNSSIQSLNSVIPIWIIKNFISLLSDTAMNSPIQSLHSLLVRWTLQFNLFTRLYRYELSNSLPLSDTAMSCPI